MRKLWIMIMAVVVIVIVGEVCFASSPPFISHPIRGSVGYRVINMRASSTHQPQWPELVCYAPLSTGTKYNSRIFNMEFGFKLQLITSSGRNYRARNTPFLVKITHTDQGHSDADYFHKSFDIWNEMTPDNDRFGYMILRQGTELKQVPAEIEDGEEFKFAKVYLTDSTGGVMVGCGAGMKYLKGQITDPNEAIQDKEWPGSDYHGSTRDMRFVSSRVELLVGPYNKDASTDFVTDDPNQLLYPEKLHFILRRFPGQDATKTRTYSSMGGVPYAPIALYSYFSLEPRNTIYGATMKGVSPGLYLEGARYPLGDYIIDEHPKMMMTPLLSDIKSQKIGMEVDRDQGNILYEALGIDDEINPVYNEYGIDDCDTYSVFSQINIINSAPNGLYGNMTLECGVFDPNTYDPNITPDPNDAYEIVDRHAIPVKEIKRDGDMVTFMSAPLVFINDISVETGPREQADGTKVWVIYAPEGSKLRMIQNSPLDYNGDNILDINDLQTLSEHWLGELPNVPFNLLLDESNFTVDLAEYAYLAKEWMSE